jgi:thioredoxin reductase (NADPH)
MHDVIIMGAGAAGMTAAMFTCRKKLKTLVIAMDVGGQTNLTTHIENYPGFFSETKDYPKGIKLMKIFEAQARRYGAQFVFGRAVKVEKKEDVFHVFLSNGEHYESKALIISYGKVPRTLGIPGEDRFIGRGIGINAAADCAKFSNKTAAVIGGGNSAVEAAILLSQYASKVYLIHRRDSFRADEITVDKAKHNSKIEFVLNSVPVEIAGGFHLDSIRLENVNSNARRELKIDGVFIEIGYALDTAMVKDLVKTNNIGEIIVNEACETNCEGVFAAGDITHNPYKQTIISAGQGATAGLSAYMYLAKKLGKSGVKIDWGN